MGSMFNWGLLHWDTNLEMVKKVVLIVKTFVSYHVFLHKGLCLSIWLNLLLGGNAPVMMGRLLGFLFLGLPVPTCRWKWVGGVVCRCRWMLCSLHSSVCGHISFAGWYRIVMLVTGICPVSSQGMPLGPTEWQDSLYFASGNLPLERFTEIWCIRKTRNWRKVDCRFSSFAGKLSIQQSVYTLYI